MRIEILIFAITAFLIFNTYHDGKYTKLLYSWKKYYTMGFFAILGIGLYLVLKRNPTQARTMLAQANNVIRYMPFDRSAINMMNPILDFTSLTSTNNENFMEGYDNNINPLQPMDYNERRILSSGKTGTKRSVSETKKKYVASQQNWKCGECQKQLNAWFEVDHKTRLEYGGSNDVSNLVALCRECHGQKTAMENM